MKFFCLFLFFCLSNIACKNDNANENQPLEVNSQNDHSVNMPNEDQVDSTSLTQRETPELKAEPVNKTIDSLKSKPPTAKHYANIKFDSTTINVDTLVAGAIVNKKFNFTNTGKIPLKIVKTDVSCGCTVPSYPFLDIMPGEKGFIGVTYNSVGKEGQQKPEIKVFTNTKDSPISLTLNVYIQNPK